MIDVGGNGDSLLTFASLIRRVARDCRKGNFFVFVSLCRLISTRKKTFFFVAPRVFGRATSPARIFILAFPRHSRILGNKWLFNGSTELVVVATLQDRSTERSHFSSVVPERDMRVDTEGEEELGERAETSEHGLTIRRL